MEPQGSDVLIVEDQRDLRETLAEVLQMAGYRTVAVANGEEALAHLRRAAPPDVILLDLQMPVMNGWTFRSEQEQSSTLAAIPVVVVSGEANLGDVAVSMHAAGHLPKPIDLEKLLRLLAHYCPKSGSGRP